MEKPEDAKHPLLDNIIGDIFNIQIEYKFSDSFSAFDEGLPN